ncbi:MAG: type II toxin-antitoxin system RelE/ParE family toxin [Candidatus Omnitrophota bacterium]
MQVEYKISVRRDVKKIDKPEARRIRDSLELKLQQDPSAGEPLKGDLAGLFKLRFGDYRVIYAKTKEGILVLRIRHRKNAYR